jgi:type IV pilus assembly protein PilV
MICERQMRAPVSTAAGFSMVEVLITMVILAFGLLGLVNLQIKLQMNEVESYQRGQALVLLEDMASRMRVNSNFIALADYQTPAGEWVGVGSDFECAVDDVCEWETLLLGAAISQDETDIGAMAGARGCIEQISAGNLADLSCAPAVYRISIAWQGLYESAVPAEECAAGEYGDDDGYRRVVSTLVHVGTPACI